VEDVGPAGGAVEEVLFVDIVLQVDAGEYINAQ
jgi:hypothetical protein